jgi:hypothetical protein
MCPENSLRILQLVTEFQEYWLEDVAGGTFVWFASADQPLPGRQPVLTGNS